MALEIKIGGTTYRGTTDYSIKQQGGAVSTTSLNVLLESHAVPLVLQVAQVYLDGTLFFAGLIQSVSTPEYSSTYETKVFSIDVSSLECLMNHRLVTKNFYYYTYTSWTQVIQYIFDNYISQEGITLGAISTTAATFDSKYSVKDKKVYDVLSEIADAIGNASWWISPDRKFYFKISTDFTSVVAPTHLTKIKLADKIGDMRTVEKMTGASAGITATEINATLLATLAARTGGSGKIEIAESDSDIHSDTKAATEASARLANYAESEKTITCTCHDLSASTPYNSWPLALTINGVSISGDFVVTERTISDHGPDAFSIAVTLKNNNYFARYGYSLKKVATIANDTASNLSDIAADNKLTASEKKDELARWNEALAAKSTLDAEADKYSVSRVAYDAAFVSLSTYLNAGTAWTSGTPAWFAGDAFTETTDIVGADYDGYWQALADTKLLLEVALRAVIQAKSDEAIAAAHEASIKMTASASSLTRSRAGALLPSTISLAAKYGDDNTVYAGRFQVELSTDGSTFAVVYQSAADESSHVYTAVPTYLGAYVVLIRIRLYKAGAFTTIFEEVTVGVSADTSSAPLYWGALTVAPASNIQADDYYFDSNVPASGGGVIRYYTGSTWAQATSAWRLYASAWAEAIGRGDAMGWEGTNGTTITETLAARNAIIAYLATSKQVSTALCSDGITRRMEIDWDNAIMSLRDAPQLSDMEVSDGYVKAYKGQGVQRRYAKFSQESLDFVDAPDTTPATPELLRARIGRLGVGSTILMDGDFYASVTSSWGAFTTISTTYCNDGKYIKTANGEIWITYTSLTGSNIYTRRFSGSSWGSQITGSTSGYSPVLCESNSGQLLLFYITTSNVVVYREWSGASWGSEVSTGITVYDSDFLSIGVLIGDDIRISTYSTSSSYLAEYHGSGTSWVSSGILSSSTVWGADYIVSDDGYQIIIYQTPTAIYQRILVGSSWGSETTVYTTSTGGIPVLVKEVNGYISLFCAGQKFVWQSPGWGSPVSSGLPTAAPTDIIQMNDGTWRCVQNYTDVGTDVVQESILIKYSQVGTGIIERGSNSNGSYIKFGDGTLICYGTTGPLNGGNTYVTVAASGVITVCFCSPIPTVTNTWANCYPASTSQILVYSPAANGNGLYLTLGFYTE